MKREKAEERRWNFELIFLWLLLQSVLLMKLAATWRCASFGFDFFHDLLFCSLSLFFAQSLVWKKEKKHPLAWDQNWRLLRFGSKLSQRERERGECVRKMKPVCNVRVCACMCVRARDKVLIHFLNEVECVWVCEQRDRGHERAREDGNEIKFSGNHKNVGGPLGCIPFIITRVGDFKPVWAIF